MPTAWRFPEGREVIAEDFDQSMAKLAINDSSYIVIVTRGHRDDMRVLRWAVQTPARYVGMIGSKRKIIGIFLSYRTRVSPPISSTTCTLPLASTSALSLQKRSLSRSPPS